MNLRITALTSCPTGQRGVVPAASVIPKSIALRLAVALVFSTSPFAVATARAQAPVPDPQTWPQDDDRDQQPETVQQYPQDSYNQPSQQAYQPVYPGQGGGQSVYGAAPGYGQGYGQPQLQPDYSQQQSSPQQFNAVQPLNAEELEQLVAPIALYPDALLAQIMAASTYPAQLAAADQWLSSMGGALPEQVAAGAAAQTGWDPSVKALTAYPQVVSMLDQNLQWTTALGNAYYNQPQDLLQTVQVLRQRAQSAGNLQPTPQEQVTENQGYISVAPTNPEVVYVPSYNPWAVYGAPVAPYPDFSPSEELGAAIGTAVQYGFGFAVSAFTHTPFGLFSWGFDWLGNSILFNHSEYCSRSREVADWGFRYGGPRAYGHGGWGQGNRFNNGGYGRQFNTFHNQPRFGGGTHYPVARAGENNGFRNQSGFNRGPTLPPARPGQTFGGRLPAPSSGFRQGQLGWGSTRPAQPPQSAYNRTPNPIARPMPNQGPQQNFGARPQPFSGRAQQFGNPGQRNGYGGLTQRPGENYGGRQSFGRDSYQAYRSPSPSYGSGGGGFGGRSGSAFAGNYGSGFSQPRPGGFHPFGGGHNAPSYGGGSRSFSGGGHAFSGGGGHNFGGGGHSFGGGGHSSGGGHSGGGGNSGHHR